MNPDFQLCWRNDAPSASHGVRSAVRAPGSTNHSANASFFPLRNKHRAPLFQTQRRENPLLRNLHRNITAFLQRNRTNNGVNRLRQHNFHTGGLQPVALSGLPSHHLVQSIAACQLGQPPLVERALLGMGGDVLNASEGRVGEDVEVVGGVLFGRNGLLQEEKRGLQVEDALAEVGEFVVERAAAVVEGFVGYRLPLVFCVRIK